jgi:protein translocase SecG subunit
MESTITIVQIVIAIALIVLIILQQRDSDLSGFLGGGSGAGGAYQQRRGLEKVFVWATAILAVAFAALALGRIFLQANPAVNPAGIEETDSTSAASSTVNESINLLPTSTVK